MTGADQVRAHGMAGQRLVLLAALVGVAVGLWLASRWWSQQREARAALPVHSGTLPIGGLDGEVLVLRDARGVPHIDAGTEPDAWRALGFVHAQDRLAQMLWLRRLARGRTAEVVGEAGLPADRLTRTLGIGALADAQARRLDAETRAVLEAYAAGVNERMERIEAEAHRPPEEPSSRAAPEPWTPADSLALVKLVAWSSGPALETGVVLAALIERLGGVGARPFLPHPDGPQGVAVVVDLPSEEIRTEGAALDDTARERPGPASLRAAAVAGGTACVLSGRHTESGAPLLLADWHLAPSAPSLLYQAHVRAGELDLAGATIPGAPVVWLGRNRDVAWAALPARAVTADLYRERIAPSEAGRAERFRGRRGWEPLARRVEHIAVRETGGGLHQVEQVVLATDRGPLVHELLSEGAGEAGPPDPLSLAWAGARPGDGIGALLRVARAGDAAELVAALERHHEPVIVMVYADRHGAAGLKLAGWLPWRRMPTGLVPVPGRMSLFEWDDPIAFASLPERVLPEDGDWLVVADDALVEGFGDAPIEWLWRSGDRAERLRELLAEEVAAEGPLGVRRSQALFADHGAPRARALVATVLALAGDVSDLGPETREAVRLLASWDGDTGRDSAGAAAYHLLLSHLTRALFAAPMGPSLFDRYVSLPHVLPGAVTAGAVRAAATYQRPGGWADAERNRRAIRESLRRTWASLSFRLGPNRTRWLWGRMHRLTFDPLTSFSAAGRSGEIGPLPLGGDATTLAFADGDTVLPFAVRAASTFRLAADPSGPDLTLTALAPGQSEHPLDPHYADGVEGWREGRARLLAMSPLLVEEVAAERLVLEPAR